MEGSLMELLGNVGEYAAELRACQLHFGVKPCRYPKADVWGLAPLKELGADDGRLDCTALDTFSVDNVGTKDIDDALSIEWHGGGFELPCTCGIHVADVASRLPCDCCHAPPREGYAGPRPSPPPPPFS